MQVKGKVYNNVLYVMLAGELDEHTSQFTRDQFDSLIMTNNFKQVIVDLENLNFMDSTGIGVLIGRYKKLKAKNKPIYICNPSTHAERIFNMTGLYDIMPKIN